MSHPPFFIAAAAYVCALAPLAAAQQYGGGFERAQSLYNATAGEAFGSACASIGDLNSDGIGDLLVTGPEESIWCGAGGTGQNVAGGGDLLTAILAGQIASGVPLASAFQLASRTSQRIIAASDSPRDLSLLENLDHVAALTNQADT